MALEHIIKRLKDGLTIKNPLHSISFYQNPKELIFEKFHKIML